MARIHEVSLTAAFLELLLFSEGRVGSRGLKHLKSRGAAPFYIVPIVFIMPSLAHKIGQVLTHRRFCILGFQENLPATASNQVPSYSARIVGHFLTFQKMAKIMSHASSVDMKSPRLVGCLSDAWNLILVVGYTSI